jgi:predicted AlkP superfamily pyrophosphatase or phosphodiesterase
MNYKKFSYTLILSLMFALMTIFTANSAEPTDKTHKVRAILITEDACSPKLTDNLAKSGKLPNLAKFRKTAARAKYVTAHYPTKTAPGHASLYCGCYGNVHGVTCNDVNKGKDDNILKLRSGFVSGSLTAEPIWMTTSKQGLKTLVMNAAQSSPPDKYLQAAPPGSLIFVNGYSETKSGFEIIDESKVTPSRTGWNNLPPIERFISGQIKVGDTILFILFLDTNKNGKIDFSTVKISPVNDSKDKDTITLTKTKRGFSRGIPVHFNNEVGGVHFSLISMDDSGRKYRLVKSAIDIEKINGKPVDEEYVRKTGGFCGNGAYWIYSKGAFGKPLPKGGDGKAEKIYLESVELVNRQLGAKFKYNTAKYSPDFVVGYTPYPDETLHMWFGYADYKKSGYDPVKGKIMKAFLEEAFVYADQFLGSAMAAASDDTYFVLASDHGMDSCNKMFYPNTILKNAGLLAVNEKGEIDLSKTKIIYGMQNGAFLLVNTNDYKDGIVPAEQKEEIIRQAVDALSRARDPKTGKAIVTGFYYPAQDEEKWGIGGAKGGDVYLDLLSGYYFSSGINKEYATNIDPIGAHIFLPLRKNVRSMFYLRGPGVEPGEIYPPCRIIDIVPTLCNYLKINPPADSRGIPVNQTKLHND